MKIGKFTTGIIGILLLMTLISAINLKITYSQISNTALTDLNESAIFDLNIENQENTDSFQIYSLIGVDINPSSSFIISNNESKTIRIYLMPQEALAERVEPLPFIYNIKNSKGEVQRETLTINIMNLERAISIFPQDINPQSEKINIEIKNRATYNFENLKLKFSSVFFNDYETAISLNSLESKTLSIPLDKSKIKLLDAGQYLLKVYLEKNGKKANKENIIKFLEKSNIETTTANTGLIINRQEVTKKNIGNLRERVNIEIEKSFLSYLFTTHKEEKEVKLVVKSDGFKRIYSWEKELNPDEELKVSVTTNWLFPIIILVLIIVAIIFTKKYTEKDFLFRKTVSFVRTKGGEFALRVAIKIKAKRYAERINITDKLPHLVNLYEKFGAVPPHKIDLQNRRLEWNIESMNKGEERIFSYIIYSSKIGVVGRFELPSAKAVYERNGKIKEITSNRSFFINEPKKLQ